MSVAIITEIAFALIQAYLLAAKQAGLTAEQAKAEFDSAYEKFMVDSSRPVEPVKD